MMTMCVDMQMKKHELQQLKEKYSEELKSNLLPFWEKRCIDEKNGGYFNCFDNFGKQLISRDKYTWSQGRFLWIWSKLAQTTCSLFSQEERMRFLQYAKCGRDFLKEHVLLGEDDWRCIFLNDEFGGRKLPDGETVYDSSIYADCFVVNGFARYALSSEDAGDYLFAKNLYASCLERVQAGSFRTNPYPLSPCYRAHGISMILSDVTKEMLRAAKRFDPAYIPELKRNLRELSDDVLNRFVDENGTLHEIVYTENNQFPKNLLGLHSNPGHSLEDMWFQIDAADILEEPARIERISKIAKRELEIGWDEEYGGLLHFCGIDGGRPEGDCTGLSREHTAAQVLDSWGDKLWWVHSEALYTTMLLYSRTKDPAFLDWHRRVYDYTFSHFPNPDREIGEWVQILRRDGKPQDKVVALPVKDPYHIIRNMILLVELLTDMLASEEA